MAEPDRDAVDAGELARVGEGVVRAEAEPAEALLDARAEAEAFLATHRLDVELV